MSSVLYVNAKGKPVTIHSYSAGSDFRSCRKLYELKRIHGWREKKENASKHFGESVEAAIRYFVDNKQRPGSMVEYFKQSWAKCEGLKHLTYTDKEGSWNDLYKMGVEMTRLAEVMWPTFKFTNPKFQLNYKKAPFPGDANFGGIEFTSYVDMLVDIDGHRTVLDIKTSGVPYPEEPHVLRLDSQLKAYAWVTGVPRVGFLVFVKGRSGSYDTGDTITLLETAIEGSAYTTGARLVVMGTNKEEGAVHIVHRDVFEAYKARSKGPDGKTLMGNALKAVKHEFAGAGVVVPVSSITKVRIQLLVDEIPADDIRDAGEIIGQDIVNISSCYERNFWPREGGVRFPENKCVWCPMRGICMDKPEVRDELVRLDIPKQQDAIEELFS